MVAIPENAEELARAALDGVAGVILVTGGATRQQSVRLALEVLEHNAPDRVLIHDAARPQLSRPVIERLAAALADLPAATPVLPVVDSLAHAAGATMGAPARREDLRRVQTPQAFRFAAILPRTARGRAHLMPETTPRWLVPPDWKSPWSKETKPCTS